MKYVSGIKKKKFFLIVSGRIVWGIYTWLGWSGEVAESIGSSVPVRGGQKFSR